MIAGHIAVLTVLAKAVDLLRIVKIGDSRVFRFVVDGEIPSWKNNGIAISFLFR